MSGSAITIDRNADSVPINWDSTVFLKKITEIVPSIIYIFNQQSQSNEYTNKSLGASLGYSAQEMLDLGSSIMAHICHPDDLPKIAQHFAKIRALNDGAVVSCEYRVRHKNGDWIWLLAHDTVFDRAPDGTVLRHIGVSSDITAQKRAEEDAIAEKLRATTINDELKAFSYSMSHDMKSPSNTLNLLLAELLETHGETLDPDAIMLVTMALSTVDRMGTLIEDVLTYTGVIDQDLDVAAVPLGALLRDVIEDLQDSIINSGAEIEIEDVPDVWADARQMRILFKNLIENAIKFCPPDRTPHVRIFAPFDPQANECAITVKDNGIGIDPKKHEEIFTIFKRLNATVAFTGTGLGLAICRRIAANHGGKIALVSEPGQGAAFTTRLPKI